MQREYVGIAAHAIPTKSATDAEAQSTRADERCCSIRAGKGNPDCSVRGASLDDTYPVNRFRHMPALRMCDRDELVPWHLRVPSGGIAP